MATPRVDLPNGAPGLGIDMALEAPQHLAGVDVHGEHVVWPRWRRTAVPSQVRIWASPELPGPAPVTIPLRHLALSFATLSRLIWASGE